MATQLEQLLTCCICLDRFRNPKLLPCQHSVCMEPCMEGLVDYVRRQVKCPECRAEHRMPYQGVQGFPNNVTLQRFLEAHIEITGETPDPTTGQIMERCGVCNEKNYLNVCAHCEKKICCDCRDAHSEIVKREISRINNQVKRASHRLKEHLGSIQKNMEAHKGNTDSVSEEIENISSRLQKAVRDRCTYLKNEVQNGYNTELKVMKELKDKVDQEVYNITANMELVDKHMDDNTPWDDKELMDCKDIFLKTVEFIRNFDYEGGDYHRRTRFNPPDDLNKLVNTLTNMGELSMAQQRDHCNGGFGGSGGLGSGPALMKSKSDHRLAAQFRDQGGDFDSPTNRRRFGDRPAPPEESSSRYGSSRYGDHDYESSGDSGRRRFRSRFMRNNDEDEQASKNDKDENVRTRPKVLDTEDVSRGPLSCIIRLYDSPRVMKRLQEREQGKIKKKEDKPKPQANKPPAAPQPTPPRPGRQLSEDEIDRIKKQNKQSDSSAAGATAVPSSPTTSSSLTSRPAGERVSSIREEERPSRDISPSSPLSSTNHSPTSSMSRLRDDDDSSSRRRYSSTRSDLPSASGTASASSPSRKTSLDQTNSLSVRSYPFSRSSSTSSVGDKSDTRSSRPVDTSTIERRLSRSNSTDSNKSLESGGSTPLRNTGAAFSTDEIRNRFLRGEKDSGSSTSRYRGSSGRSSLDNSSSRTGATPSSTSRFQSRFLARAGTPSAGTSRESENEDRGEDEESSDDSESEESEDSSDDEDNVENKTTTDFARSDIGSLLPRSAQARDTGSSSSRHSWGDSAGKSSASSDSGYNSSRYGAGSNSSSNNNDSGSSSYRRPSYLGNNTEETKDDDFDTRYPVASKYLGRSKVEEVEKPSFQSRFLNRSKSSAVLGPGEEDDKDSPPEMGPSRTRFEALKERRQRLARSKSSAGLEDDDATGATSSSSTATSRPRYGTGSDVNSTSSTRRGVGSSVGNDEGSSPAQLSNWARYLKNKYGNRTTKEPSSSAGSGLGEASGTSSSLTNRLSTRPIARSRSSHLLGLAKDGESTDTDSKNADATPTSPTGTVAAPTHLGSIHRSQYLQKQRVLLKIGSRGSDPASFTWPRGIAVGPDNNIVVADSSNHRVQMFDQNGRFVIEFGSYGSGEGEFDCLAGVAVNRIGQFIIADRYNHRIQVFDPSGGFLRAFGAQGSGDGRFSYPWGVATDALGFIYVCDKENHRVQVFQSDGTFVGKFGSMGNKSGQLEHPHYIAVSSTNRVIVSDSNNHRIQVFDINGKVVNIFGTEGGEEGQFKFPRGVAVDDQGYIFVADSGNNRIQIFHPDGKFLRAFGCWGSNDGEFKGLEGVAVMSNGNILVCDRENHRIQIF